MSYADPRVERLARDLRATLGRLDAGIERLLENTGAARLDFRVDPGMERDIARFQAAYRFRSQAAAIRALISLGLEAARSSLTTDAP